MSQCHRSEEIYGGLGSQIVAVRAGMDGGGIQHSVARCVSACPDMSQAFDCLERWIAG